MRAILQITVVSLVVSRIAAAANAALLTVTQSILTRPQDGITYLAIDFFYSSSAGSEFLNYTLDVQVSAGSLYDPARLQDDRQTYPPAAGQDGNTAGLVDTWANTVMSSAAKIDGGYAATISANPAYYRPVGSGAAPPFQRLQWDVFDSYEFDDNNLTDHPDGPFTATSPYHIARVLASTNATGSIDFIARETVPGSGQVTVTPFSFCCGLSSNHPPDVHPEPPNAVPIRAGDPVVTQFTATDVETPASITFSDAQLSSFVPYFPVPNPNPTFNGTVDSVGLFTWDTTGFRAGIYTINVVATDPQGLSSAPGGNFVVQIFVPEPLTGALCGLAMFGVTGLFARHRESCLCRRTAKTA